MPPVPSPFEVRVAAIRKAWRAAGSGVDEVWLLVESGLPFTEVEAAIDAANDVSLQTSGLMGTFPTPTSGSAALMLDGLTDVASLTAWLDGFAAELTARGGQGVVKAAPSARVPDWVFGDRLPVPTAFLNYELDLGAMTADPDRNARWHVPSAATADITRFTAQWARRGNGTEVLLRQNLFVLRLRASDPDIADPLAHAVEQTGMAGVEVIDPHRQTGRHVSFAPGGDCVFQVYGAHEDRLGTIPALSDALLALPALTTYGCVRSARSYALDCSDVENGYGLPGIRETHVRYNKHLLLDHVPDAHGLQVLTDRHLAHARDLSGWEITDLGAGRHLVAAPDLAPWYAEPTPDPEVLARARNDFGPMLITEQLVAENPPPWR